MPARIVLVRHGRSAHVHTGEWLSAAGVQRWRTESDAAGITPDDEPPRALVRETEHAALVVASEMRRAIASAQRLAPGRDIRVSTLLRETPLAIPTRIPFPLPLSGWDALIHLGWGLRILGGAEAPPEEVRRARDAAAWLSNLARVHSSVVAVTHGVFRRLLAARLVE